MPYDKETTIFDNPNLNYNLIRDLRDLLNNSFNFNIDDYDYKSYDVEINLNLNFPKSYSENYIISLLKLFIDEYISEASNTEIYINEL